MDSILSLMNKFCSSKLLFFVLLPLLSTSFLPACAQQRKEAAVAQFSEAGYENRPGRDPAGIDKYYLGRQIAHVMGHEGAGWLERPDREREERTDLLLQALHLKPTDVVADIGAGTGYFTFGMSRLVPQGKVLAVDIQQEMLDRIEQKKRERETPNVETILGTASDPHLPAQAVDLVLLVDAYHEFAYPREMMEAVVRALRPGGRVALVEYKAEDPAVPIKPLHKMTLKQAQKEMAAVGLRFVENKNLLPQQHLMLFERPIN